MTDHDVCSMSLFIPPERFPQPMRLRVSEVPEPSALGLPFEDLRLTTPDKVTLACHLMLFSQFYCKLSSSPKSEKRLSCMDTGVGVGSSRTRASRGSSGWSASTKGKEREDEAVAAGRATIIMFHGNAMTHGDVIDLAAQFLNMGCNVLTVSYRGYGHSTGRPSEGGTLLFLLLVATFSWGREELGVLGKRAADLAPSSAHRPANRCPNRSGLPRPPRDTVPSPHCQSLSISLIYTALTLHLPQIVFGQSLGGAVAIDLTSRNPTLVSALILENTFMSIPLLVRDWPSPIGPLSFLCTQRWPSIDRIPRISKDIPILMLSGDRDVVVPPKHMRGLWAAAKRRGDNDEDAEVICSPLLSFLCKPGRRSSNSKVDAVTIDVEAPGGGGPGAEHGGDDLDNLESPASIWNGSDLFQYIAGTGHGEYLCVIASRSVC